MKTIAAKFFFTGLVLLSLCWASGKNVIFFIGDGMGPEQVLAAQCYLGERLSFENFPYQASCTTHSANNSITDSAAAATALATGFKVNNDVISMALPGDESELPTLLEYYKAKGKRTGLITTAYLTHATPAGFGAHELSRANYSAIGQDYLNQTRPNLLFGGGGNGLTPAITEAAGYLVTNDTAGFWDASFSGEFLSAQFGTAYMPYEYDHLAGAYPYPHLSEMVAKALIELADHPGGFFLMVEAGRIDHACHVNDLARSVHETIELSHAVDVAGLWAAGRDDTLILVTADHETGGLRVVENKGVGVYPTVEWSTTGHSAADVPVYAWGKDAELISGELLDNTDMFAICTADDIPNAAPLADNQVVETAEDTDLAIVLTGTDADGGTLTFTIVTSPSQGVLTGTAPKLTYHPDLNAYGLDTFTFVVFDGQDSSAPATVSITVNPVNDPPPPPASLTATTGAASVTLNWAASSDPDGDLVTYTVYRSDLGVEPLVYGLGVTTFKDTAVQNEVSYEYYVQATDGSLSADSVSVTAMPSAAAYNAYATEDPTVSYGILTGDFTDLRQADGAAQTLTEVSRGNAAVLSAEYRLHTTASPAEVNGLTLHLVVTVPRSWDDPWQAYLWNGIDWENITEGLNNGTFTPAGDPRNYVGADGLVRVGFTDGGSVRKEQADQLAVDVLYAEISCGAPVNRYPVAVEDTATTAPDSPVTVAVLANDYDPDGDSVTVLSVSSPVSGGTVRLNEDQTITCTPEAGFTGSILFTYTLGDGNGGTALGNVTVTVLSGQELVYVGAINMGLTSAGKNWKATVEVLVHNQNAQPVAGALVSGDWFYNGSLTLSGGEGVTDETGKVWLTSPPEKASTGDVFKWVINGISLAGHEYAQEWNAVSSVSISP